MWSCLFLINSGPISGPQTCPSWPDTYIIVCLSKQSKQTSAPLGTLGSLIYHCVSFYTANTNICTFWSSCISTYIFCENFFLKTWVLRYYRRRKLCHFGLMYMIYIYIFKKNSLNLRTFRTLGTSAISNMLLC